MKYQGTVFSQLLQLLPRDRFQEIVEKYKGDARTHKLNCWSQFVCLFYGQLRQRDSLRDIETGLEVQSSKLYHLGLKQPVKRSTLSDANNKRPYRIYEELFGRLLKKCQRIHVEKSGFRTLISSIDSTTLELCHSLFPWTTYRSKKGGLKLHMHYDHDSDLPDVIRITDAVESDLKIGKQIQVKPDSILIFDRAYYDYAWFYALDQQNITFVSRVKKNFTYSIIGQHPVDPDSSIILDQDIQVPGPTSHRRKRYFKPLRLITYVDPENGDTLQFMTNNESFKPETIQLLYKQRWKIELFFKWLKQNLKIKTFLGTSKNAVFTQIWIAMITYLLLWYIKNQTHYRFSLLKLSRIINEAIFERVHFIDLLHLRSFSQFYSDPSQLSFGFT